MGTSILHMCTQAVEQATNACQGDLKTHLQYNLSFTDLLGHGKNIRKTENP